MDFVALTVVIMSQVNQLLLELRQDLLESLNRLFLGRVSRAQIDGFSSGLYESSQK